MHDGRSPAPNRRETPFADADDPVVSAVALLVLGAGLGSLFGVPLLTAVEFWVIFAIGYAVVVPLTSLLRGRADDAGADGSRRERVGAERVADADADERSDDPVDTALDRLRDRYVRGELSEAQFERKLETLLETGTPEDARERLDRTTDSAARDGTAEPEFERDR